MQERTRRMRHGLVVAAAVATATMATPGAAVALSCVAGVDATPRAIAEGTEQLPANQPFRDVYDGAILGEVVSLTVQNDGSLPDYGRTEVEIEVTGTLGPPVDRPVVLVQPDPGWMSGYGFQAGKHYFIPYTLTEAGPATHLCTPIAEIEANEAPDLLAMAEQHAWPGEVRGADGTPLGAPSPDDGAETPPSDEGEGMPPGPSGDDAGGTPAPTAPGRPESETVRIWTAAGLAGLVATGLGIMAWWLPRRVRATPSRR